MPTEIQRIDSEVGEFDLDLRLGSIEISDLPAVEPYASGSCSCSCSCGRTCTCFSPCSCETCGGSCTCDCGDDGW
jgi:hypothetical protein